MIIGHERHLRYFERVLRRGTLAHAYLFHGPEGVGKKALALMLARSLVCRAEAARSLGGCGRCDDCRRLVAFTHPDLLLLSPEHPLVEEGHSREIGIKNVHELKRLLGLSAWGGGWRVAIIASAERLSREAQSALLKILEEPGARTVFFLVTSAHGALLPTVRSRAIAIGFSTLSDAEMSRFVSHAPPPRREELLAFAEGRPGIAARMMADQEFLVALRAERSRFERLRSAGLGEQLAFSEEVSREPRTLEAFIEFLIRSVRRDLGAAVAGQARGGGAPGRPVPLAALVGSLFERAMLLDSVPVNRRLLADRVFFDLLRLAA